MAQPPFPVFLPPQKRRNEILEANKMNSEKQKQLIYGYCDAVGDLLCSDAVQQMRQYPHHKTVSTFHHSVYVSFLTYRLCNTLHLHTAEATRAALLHDFYLYNWYVEKHGEYHVWYHPKTAVKNAEHYFGALTERQKNMILSHMFPLFVEPPKTKEAFVLTFADKIGATKDLIGLSKRYAPILTEIETELKHRGNTCDHR